MSEYTKGPWDVNYDGSHWNDKDDYYVTANPTGALGGQRNIALLMGTYTGKQTEANASLMAAAPDLLEALKGLRACISETRGEPAREAVEAADKAIAKAQEKPQ